MDFPAGSQTTWEAEIEQSKTKWLWACQAMMWAGSGQSLELLPRSFPRSPTLRTNVNGMGCSSKEFVLIYV